MGEGVFAVSMIKRSTVLAGCVVAGSALGAGAMPLPLSIDSIVVSWTDITGGVQGNESFINTGTADYPSVDPEFEDAPFVAWGDEINDGQSSFFFDPVDSVPLLNATQTFDLGFFGHDNRPIRDPFLETATLNFDISGSLVGGPSVSFTLLALVTLDESSNDGDPCEFGGSQPCADQVLVLGLEGEDNVFVHEKIEYTVQLTGLDPAEFITPEEDIFSAEIQAIFTAQEIPLPATWILLLSGLAGLGWVRRRA